LKDVLYFDTSKTNMREGETCHIVTGGSGSGSNRAEHAVNIERAIPQLSDEDLGVGDVAIVMFSLGGGSGSVISAYLIKEYAKRGIRVIAVAVADTSSSVSARNTLNTLKTLTAVSKKNGIYLPLILVTNDEGSRREVDHTVVKLVTDALDLLVTPVYEVDRTDRLNWINPTKVVDSPPGIKIMSFISNNEIENKKIVIGAESTEMLDSLLILQSEDEDARDNVGRIPTRSKKVGFYAEKEHRRIIGRVSSDISAVENIITYVDKMQGIDKAQKHSTLDRLDSTGDSDLII
jgi:hypothetical protein